MNFFNNLLKPRTIIIFFLIGRQSAFESSVWATPLMAAREANNCQGCHEPGRSQKPVLWRRCTLDCQGCHVDPNGSGPRNQWGYYYSQDQLAIFNYFKPIDPLQDTSRFDIHLDSRMMTRQQDDIQRTFPMNHEMSLRLRPLVNWLHLTYQQNYMGRIGESNFSFKTGDRRLRTKWAVMVDGLPMNLYVKYFQGQPVYGLRRPNHTLWIRERVGLDQFAQTRGFSFGGTPNVPFFHMSLVDGDPLAEEEDKQKGYTVHSGLRGVTLGWHVHGSFWNTSSKKNAIEMSAVGGGLNLFKFLVLGEKNWRKVTEKKLSFATRSQFSSQAPRVHPGSTIDEFTIAYTGIPGFWFGMMRESLKDYISDAKRLSGFIDFHPVPNLQLEFWRRIEVGHRTLYDSLAIFHLYLDI